MATVGELCGRHVIAVTREATVSEAAKLMRSEHVGSIVIVDKLSGGLRKPLGIVTDRDLVVEVTATGLDPETITVGDIMRRELVTVRADRGPLEAIELMRAKGVRRLPVVNDEGRLLGLVAFDDLLDAVTEQLFGLAKTVQREQMRETSTRK